MSEFPEPTYLFVYGTFLKGMAHSSFLDASNRAQFISEATISAQLYDTGAFPAALLSRTNDLQGEIYQLNEPWTVLSTIDFIEGFNLEHPKRSLFKRETCRAKNGNQSWEVQVYIYNQSVESLPRIESGSYRDYLQTSRLKDIDE
ncbi:MAG: gamma-glutamylcyclotransferase [Calditrichaeota bacterium]|nr:MAG: gamma-glutamylcyclotransferase [Calditrichota bacterium]